VEEYRRKVKRMVPKNDQIKLIVEGLAALCYCAGAVGEKMPDYEKEIEALIKLGGDKDDNE